MNDQMNPSPNRSKAVVTGAASGIGYALSVQLSARGRQVIMVDRDPRVVPLSADIHGAEACVANLATEQDLSHVKSLAQSSDVNWVVNCAGIGFRSNIGSTRPSSLANLVALNIHALTQLSEAAIINFRSAGEGVLVNISSSAAFQPLPGMAAYGASKAYVLSFSEALAAENTNPAIIVLTICPSGVETNFQKSAGVQRVSGERLLTAEEVAAAILRGANRRRSQTIMIGVRSFHMSLLARLLPRSINIRLWKRLMNAMR